MPALTLEAGKFYRTRAGDKVGPVLPDNTWFRIEHALDGRTHYASDGTSAYRGELPADEGREHLDLVAEWVEPSADADTGHTGPGKIDIQRLADAAERIATALEAIEKHLAPVITGTPVPEATELPNADGWIKWVPTGDRLHPPAYPTLDLNTQVTVAFRGLSSRETAAVARLDWWGDGTGPSEIVAYRLAK